MRELRKDPITREWAIIAPDADPVPAFAQVLRPPQIAAPSEPCPFCPGREAACGPELLAYSSRSGWRVRVVANTAPALTAPGDPDRRDHLLYEAMQAVGVHEIVIETPRHDVSLADLEAAQVEEVLWAYRERAQALQRLDWARYVSICRHHGDGAHPHSRIVATPVVPQGAWDHVRGLRQYYDYRGRCALCHIIEQECQARERVVHENRACVTLAPYASRHPFELWLLPRRHAPGIGQVEPTDMRHLAAALKDALLRLKEALSDPPYHYHLLMAPCNLDEVEHVHWSIAITPRLALPGALELGCGMFVNPVPPEEAARSLRAALKPTLEVAAARR